jgi:predicted SnoaL-like aldol condensation-catalyzing enzyme
MTVERGPIRQGYARIAMKKPYLCLGILLVCSFTTLHAQVAPVPLMSQQAMLKSDDPRLARNKKHVFDFWRIVYEGGHVEQAANYMAEGYIQHNPNLPSGRQTFVEFFSKARPPKPIADHMKMPVIAIVAEGNLVSVFTARKVRDRSKPDRIYTITWFDMFRIDAQGLIAEHWDPSETWVDGKPPGAEFFQEWDH